MALNIIFRACETNISSGSIGDESVIAPRYKNYYKLDILRKCWLSIQSGLDEKDTIIVAADRVTPETLRWMSEHCAAGTFEVFNIQPEPPHPYPKYHPISVGSFTHLAELIVETAERHPTDILYHVEDDYLHLPQAIPAMKAFFQNNYNGFYVPYDYPDRYSIDTSRSCEVHLTNIGHVRTVPSCTLTMAALGDTWDRYRIDVLRAGVFCEDSWTWKVAKQSGIICPIPGHSTHFQNHCITPGIDWDIVWANLPEVR